MTFFQQHPGARWSLPAAALAVVVGSGLTLSSAQADPGLPAKTAEQLLVAVQGAQVEHYSGTVTARVDLGLGSLSGLTKRTTSLQNLIDGTSTLRVWADGPQRQRVALVGDGGEADVIRNGRSVWTWNAQERTAVHTDLPEHQGTSTTTTTPRTGADLPKTPQEAAALVLSRLEPSTRVTTSGAATVAGRAAYELVLTPRSGDTLVRRVLIDIDAATSMPLRVRVTGSNPDKPAIDVGFTSLDLARPDAARFAFTPPAGTTVTTKTATTTGAAEHGAASPKDARSAARKPVEVGTGWSTVSISTLPPEALTAVTSPPAKDAAPNAAVGVLAGLPTSSGAWGTGRVFEGTLVSVALTDDGRLAVGAVPQERLLAALASTR